MNPELEKWAEKASRRARSPWLIAAAVLCLLGLNALRATLRQAATDAQRDALDLAGAKDESLEALAENQGLRDERSRDVAKFKDELGRLTQSRRALYEGGLQLQEEKRLLEKQLEIMTTYLLVDEAAGKVSLMRGEQALETYPIGTGYPQLLGGEARPLSTLSTVISKERFAHPERGKSEQGPDGQLQWEPPQVGTSVRANALGEYVVFTRGPLILHGPPKKPEEHQAFAHACLGLSLSVARKLYEKTYIGTKIVIKTSPHAAVGALSAAPPPKAPAALSAQAPKK